MVRCVYTTMIGRYEKLNEQPVAARSEISFICLTDDLDLRSESWQMRIVPPVFGMDPVRSQRDMKIRPHVYLPDFDVSLYIDNSVLLTEPPERLFERYFVDSSFSLPEHSYRETTLDEFMEVAKAGLDDRGRIFEQLDHYTIDHPEVLQQKPYWTAILLRDHGNKTVRAMLEIWAAHVHRYSRRDQLSVNVAFRKSGLSPEAIRIDNFKSWFHTWPHIDGRHEAAGLRESRYSLTPLIVRIHELEQELTEQHRLHQEVGEVLDSTTWQIATAFRNSASRHPYLVRLGRRLFRRDK